MLCCIGLLLVSGLIYNLTAHGLESEDQMTTGSSLKNDCLTVTSRMDFNSTDTHYISGETKTTFTTKENRPDSANEPSLDNGTSTETLGQKLDPVQFGNVTSIIKTEKLFTVELE